LGNNRKLDVPPHTNRGAENTVTGSPQEGLVPCLDWVQVTLKTHEKTEWEIIDILGLPRDIFRESSGGYGWTHSLRFSNITVFFGGQPYYHVQVTGQGCRMFETTSSRNWSEVFRDFITMNCRFTRLDLAIDDFKGYFTIGKLIRLAKKGCVRSPMKKGRSVEEFELGDGKELGKSLYLGKASSRLQVRFYDKREERIAKGYEIEDLIPIWNRTEIQLRDERAETAAAYIATDDELGKHVFGILKHYCEFVVQSKDDTNKARWKVQGFWDKFLSDVMPLRLAQKHPEPTLLRKVNWLERQVKKTMGQILIGSPDGQDILMKMAAEGVEDIKDYDYEIMERTKEEYLSIMQARKVLDLDDLRAEKLAKLRSKEEFSFVGLPIKEVRSDERLRADLEYLVSIPADKEQWAAAYERRKVAVMAKRVERKRRSLEMKNALTDGTVEGHKH